MFDEGTTIILGIGTFLLGILVGYVIGSCKMEIQEIKPVDNGYYITINNEIYYKEVQNDDN